MKGWVFLSVQQDHREFLQFYKQNYNHYIKFGFHNFLRLF